MVILLIPSIKFDGNYTTYVLPGQILLRVRPSSITISGDGWPLWDQAGNEIETLARGYYVIQFTREGTLLRVCAVNVSSLLRQNASEFAPANYTPNATRRTGGQSYELGAHLKGIDAMVGAARGYVHVTNNDEQILVDGPNILRLGTGNAIISGATLLDSTATFLPDVDGVWKIELLFAASRNSHVESNHIGFAGFKYFFGAVEVFFNP